MKKGNDILLLFPHIICRQVKKIIPGNSNKSIFKIIEECSLNEEDEFKLMTYVKSKKRVFISSPFSRNF